MDTRRADGHECRWMALALEPTACSRARLCGRVAEPTRLDRIWSKLHPGHLGQRMGRPVLQRSNVRDRCTRETPGCCSEADHGNGRFIRWVYDELDRHADRSVPLPHYAREHLHDGALYRDDGPSAVVVPRDGRRRSFQRSAGIRPVRARATREELENADV